MESFPVILLVVAVHMQILFQSLICSFSLPIAFGVISRSEVKLHIQSLSERSEKMGNELRSAVRCDMSGNSMFGKHMDYEELCKLCGCDSVVGCNENSLLRKSIYNFSGIGSCQRNPYGRWHGALDLAQVVHDLQ